MLLYAQRVPGAPQNIYVLDVLLVAWQHACPKPPQAVPSGGAHDRPSLAHSAAAVPDDA